MHLVLVLPLGLYLPIHLYISAILICRLVDLSTCRPVDLVLLSTTNIYICHLYVLPKSTCRLVDLSTCRASAIVNNKDPVRVGLVCGSVYGWARVSRPVDLSTCRPSAIVNNKDPVRVRVSVWLGLWLGWG